jgi:bacillithiol system protein YtxJ
MTKQINWTELTSSNQLEKIQTESQTHPVIIFKHSTRCSISKSILDRLERNWKSEELLPVKPYFLDLISYREISNRIAETFHVEHESPQVLIIHNGKSIYDKSHYEIDFSQIKNALKEATSIKS